MYLYIQYYKNKRSEKHKISQEEAVDQDQNEITKLVSTPKGNEEHNSKLEYLNQCLKQDMNSRK